MSLLLPALEVKIDCYEGPLAVLVTLIKKNKVSIWDIPLSMITERFLEYVEFVREMNLKIAEDFIDMASLLIFIKSRMLLPLNNMEEEDPREGLIERIMEYERMRSMTEQIKNLPLLNRDTFCKERVQDISNTEYDLLHLCRIFLELIKNRKESYIVIREIRPTLEEKLNVLKEILGSSGIFVWDIEDEEDHSEKVATVLGMLELTKARMARIFQKRPFGRIVLRKRTWVADEGIGDGMIAKTLKGDG